MSYNIGGPDWIWKLIGILVVLGFLTLVYLVTSGLVWLFKHVHIY